MMDRVAGRRVLFLHNPKAGGTSISSAFTNQLAGNEFVVGMPSRAWVPVAIDAKAYRENRYLAGHVGYRFAQELGADFELITNFRHPVTRLASLYDYWWNLGTDAFIEKHPHSGPSAVQGLSFSDFVTAEQKPLSLFVENLHARQLFDCPWSQVAIGPVELEIIYRRIDAMRWFYVCEEPAASERWFHTVFPDVPFDARRRENETSYSRRRRTYPSPAETHIIFTRNSADLAIYNYAVRRLYETTNGLESHSNVSRVTYH